MNKYKYICGMFTDNEDGYTIDCDDMAEEYNKLAKQLAELKEENERLSNILKATEMVKKEASAKLEKAGHDVKRYKIKIQKLQQQLKDNTKQVCERIIDIINKEFNCCGYIEDIDFDEFKQKLLDQIEKGENDEKTTYK